MDWFVTKKFLAQTQPAVIIGSIFTFQTKTAARCAEPAAFLLTVAAKMNPISALPAEKLQINSRLMITVITRANNISRAGCI